MTTFQRQVSYITYKDTETFESQIQLNIEILDV